MDKRIRIISDSEGKNIVLISDIRFKGKRKIDWKEVEKYLKEYIGECYEVIETSDKVFINSEFPGELKGSEDTKRFALPVYNSNTDELERFNVFRIEMLIRHAADGNLYLYDMVNIKKETSTPLEH